MKEKKNKVIVLIIFVVSVLVLTLGIAYARLTGYGRGNQELVMGDIYMYYNENSSAIVLDEIITSDTYNPNNYFEFTVSGKNTYSKKDIWYDIVLSHGSVPDDKTIRISDELLSFRLVEVVNSEEIEIFKNKSYTDLANKRIYVNSISKNTLTELNKTYRLYMWISKNFTVCAGEATGCTYNEEDYDKLYASIDVSMTGNLNEIVAPLADSVKEDIYSRVDASNNLLVATVEDGITYISGSNDQDSVVEETDIDFNYVWYSGKLWRITSINPDGTIKMITDNVITTISYNNNARINLPYFYYNENDYSTAYEWLRDEFLTTLYNYENIIETNYEWNVAPLFYNPISTKLDYRYRVQIPIGMLNTYEYYKSYEKLGNYSSGYLNLGTTWWLMNLDEVDNPKTLCVFTVDATGSPITSRGFDFFYGIRPTIVLKSGTMFKSGNGTKNNPYILSGDISSPNYNKTLLTQRVVGEYVNFDNELYRIVDIEDDKTKLVKADFLTDENGNKITKVFSSSVIYGSGTDDTYWDYYLNNTWYNSISFNYKNMLVQGPFYFANGDTNSEFFYYKSSICKTATLGETIKECEKTTESWTGYVGAMRATEMFSFYFMHIDEYYEVQDVAFEWLITPEGNGGVFVYSIIYANNTMVLAEFPVAYYELIFPGFIRPSIYLSSQVKITEGDGSVNKPFEISL